MQLTAIQYLNTAMVLIWTNYTVQNDIFTVGLVIGFRTYRTHMENMSESNIKNKHLSSFLFTINFSNVTKASLLPKADMFLRNVNTAGHRLH